MAATDWLKDSSNQNLLKFLGTAAVAIAVAGWTAYSTVFPKETAKPAAPAVVVSAIPPVSAVAPSQPASAPVGGDTVIAHSGVAVKVNGDHNQISIGK